MYTIHKLRPDRSYGMILLPFAVLAAFIAAGGLLGIRAAYGVGAAVFLVYCGYSFATFLRTRNAGFVVVTLFQLSAGVLASLYAAYGPGRAVPAQGALFLAGGVVLFGAWSVLLVVTRRIKWRGRDLLELAAASVDQVGDGYTARPLPVGRTDITRDQLLEFTAFARRHLIAATYVGRDRVAFVPVAEGREPAFILGLRGNYLAETWVSIDFDGNVAAFVSKRDYLAYREAIAFDELCASLGNMFVEFLDLFRRGEAVRIVDRLDSAGIPFYA